MNVFHRVAQRSMRANRMRTIVTIIGVILSAAMFTAVTTFATTLLTHLQRVTAYLDGAYYLGVHNVDADTLASMRADSDIEAFSAAEVLGYAEVTVNNSNKPYLYVEAIDSGFSDRMPVHLVEGRMPENGTELLIPDHLQAYSDAGTYLVGDTLTLDYSDNGCGFNPAAVMDCGMGLSNIVSRVHSINGHCNVEGAKGKGMHAAIRVNVRGEASAAAGARRRTAARRRKRR